MPLNAAKSPFKLDDTLSPTAFKTINRLLTSSLERILALHKLDAIYQSFDPVLESRHFLRGALSKLGINYTYNAAQLAQIPATGKVIVVANHPFGAIEGIILAELLLQIRLDIKILANYHLGRVSPVADLFIPVDPFGGKHAVQNNIKPLREALSWLRRDGLLLIFPAGTVSHLHLRKGRIIDPAWHANLGRLVKLTGAPVTPIYVHGANSVMFQLAGMIHPRLRTALLPREIINKARVTVELHIGQCIPSTKLMSLHDEEKITRYLRFYTYMLGVTEAREGMVLAKFAWRRMSHGQAIMPAISGDTLRAEIQGLPTASCLVSSGSLQVYCAYGRQIPHTLREIGRLRELTFRAVGEGTGKAIDLDLYDAYYLHLFLWDSEKEVIAGAYRMGLVDEILAKYGRKGLYTASLFNYKTALMHELEPAIELGRSFIRQEYQRNFNSLLLLWKGIGHYIANNPRYRIVFGPVSISSEYRILSRRLLTDFLKTNSFQPHLARHVKPRHPFRIFGRRLWDSSDLGSFQDIDMLSEMLEVLEPDQKGVPVLVRHYLKLGGRFIGFNVDKDFNNAIDGLMVTDMLQVDVKQLRRYLGHQGAENFLRYHQISLVANA